MWLQNYGFAKVMHIFSDTDETTKAGPSQVQKELSCLGLQSLCPTKHPAGVYIWDLALECCALWSPLALPLWLAPVYSAQEIPFYFKFRGSVLISKVWYELKQTFFEKISTKNSCFSIPLTAASHPDVHVPFTGSLFQYFFLESKNIWSTLTLNKWHHQ